MKHKFFALGLIALLCCAFFWPNQARAADAELETSYYTLQNQERYTLIHEVKVSNFGPGDVYGIDLSLPLMDNDTPVYSRKLREQIVPWPDSIEVDERGRRTAYYHVDTLPTGTELVFTQKYVVDLAAISYDSAITRSGGGYDDQMASLYLLPSPNIESDNAEIIAFAKKSIDEAVISKTNIYDVAKEAFKAVNFYMSYVSDEYNYKGALLALRRGQGVCEDYSSLYVAVLRALGIAARQQGGYLFLPYEHNKPPLFNTAQQRLNLNTLRHTWVEFYVPGQGWVVADPTFTYTFELTPGVPTKFIRWSYFASITDERRYLFFYEGSVNEDRGEMKMAYSADNHYVKHDFSGYLLKGSQAAFYNDLPGHWAESAIMRLSDMDEPLLQGLGNGMFGVNQPMTRAQLVTCLQRMLKSPAAGPKFTDLPVTHWAYRDIGAAQQGGWINGYPDGSFRPDKAVTRAELARILVDVFQLQHPQAVAEQPEAAEQPEGIEQPEAAEQTEQAEQPIVPEATSTQDETQPAFLDLGLPGYAWADEAITILAELGLSNGNGDGYYQPQRPVTRAEFAAFLDRIILLIGQ